MKSERDGINPAAEPSGTGCVECLALGGWWFHLRRCAECGHIGCCDSSPNQHASKHYAATGHPIITSFERGERWFYDYRTSQFVTGPKLCAPHAHPLDQSAPGPTSPTTEAAVQADVAFLDEVHGCSAFRTTRMADFSFFLVFSTIKFMFKRSDLSSTKAHAAGGSALLHE
jgi:hypothetical protein